LANLLLRGFTTYKGNDTERVIRIVLVILMNRIMTPLLEEAKRFQLLNVLGRERWGRPIRSCHLTINVFYHIFLSHDANHIKIEKKKADHVNLQ